MSKQSTSYSKHILNMINDWRKEKGAAPYENASFVLNSDVDCRSGQPTLSAKTIINDGTVDKVIERMLRDGPSWLHALVYLTEEGRVIIALDAGNPVGAPKPDIMFGDATERNPKLRIVN